MSGETRRNFLLRYAAMALSTAAPLAACSADDSSKPPADRQPSKTDSPAA